MKSECICTEEGFLSDMDNHGILVAHEVGVDRRIRFKEPHVSNNWFELITWNGCLCINGDHGTYTFARNDDMFSFFRDSGRMEMGTVAPLKINPDYWGEKLQSISQYGGYRVFDKESFRERVKSQYMMYIEDDPSRSSSYLWREIERQVLDSAEGGEHEAYRAVNDFKWNGFVFNDFFDGGGTECFTFHYIWCLYAIVWGIRVYDKAVSK